MENTTLLHYRIGKKLGRGGMGEVYEAVDLDLDRPVALKFIAPELAADPATLRRFEREARAAAALSHPHIATLFAFERAGDHPFIAMKLLSGERLRDRMERGALEVGTAMGVARDVASALAMAHRRGVVHRDIKPENLMFDGEGTIQVTDFGLASAAHASRLTTSGATLGTAAYMAPEAVRGESGPPSDVFALGVVLHEILAGELPFPGETPLAQLYSIANADPRPLRAARPEVPESLDALVLRMLVKDPAERPDAEQVAKELAALTGVPLPALEPRALEVPPAHDAVPPGSVKRPWRRAVLVALGVPGLIALAWVGWARWGVDDDRRDEARILNNRGHDSLRAGRLGGAEQTLRSALRKVPDYAEARINLGLTLVARGDLDGAARELRTVANGSHGTPAVRAVAHSHLADLDMRDEAWASAVENLRGAVALDSTELTYWNNLTYALIRSRRAPEAKQTIDRGLARFPTSAALHTKAALLALLGEDVDEAAHEVNRAISRDAAYAPAHGVLARVQARRGERDNARNEWQIFLELGPTPADSAEVAADLTRLGVLP